MSDAALVWGNPCDIYCFPLPFCSFCLLVLFSAHFTWQQLRPAAASSSLLLAGCTGCLQAQLDHASTLELSIQEMSWEWHEIGAHLQQPAAGAAGRLTCHKSGRQTTSQNMRGPSVWKAASSSQHGKHKSSSICTQCLCCTACITPTAPCYEGSPQL